MPTLADIAAVLEVSVDGSRAATPIEGIASLGEASDRDISFVESDAYLEDLRGTRAAAVIVHQRVKLPDDVAPAVLRVSEIDPALARIARYFAPPAQTLARGVHPDARIDPSATLGSDPSIGPFVVIGQRSRIGDRCSIHCGVCIGDDVVIGDDCTIWPNVVLRERISLGNRVIIHAGSVIGTDGFGYRWDGQQHSKVPQIGTVIIEDDVEIGSCACIDRSRFGATRIGRGTKIDNLVQVAHNCVVGAHSILAGQVGLAGSVTLGTAVTLGGQTAVTDHVKVGDRVMAAGRSAIATDIDPKSIVSGMPALPHRQTLREQVALRRLPDLINQVKKLEEEIDRLRKDRNA